jgi:hypothetical protein
VERNVKFSDKELKIIFEDLNGIEWFVSSDRTVFIDYKHNMNNWPKDKKLINQLKGGG